MDLRGAGIAARLGRLGLDLHPHLYIMEAWQGGEHRAQLPIPSQFISNVRFCPAPTSAPTSVKIPKMLDFCVTFAYDILVPITAGGGFSFQFRPLPHGSTKQRGNARLTGDLGPQLRRRLDDKIAFAISGAG